MTEQGIEIVANKGGMLSKGVQAFHQVRSLFSYHRKWTESLAKHDVNNVYRKTFRDVALFGFGSVQDKAILDLGCGQRFAFALQAAADGAQVTALDTDYVRPDFLPLYFFRTARSNGFKRAIMSATRRCLFDGLYYRELALASGKESFWEKRRGIQFGLLDSTAATYPLPDGSFDLISSNAVLEHVADVSRYFSEVRRMLKPGAFFHGFIHNFYSLSGGHNLEWAFPDECPSTTVPAWDHLRGNIFPTHVFLNRLKPEQYRIAASSYLDVLMFEDRGINHDPPGIEGEKLLTAEIKTTLPDVPRELLLTRAYCLICRKSNSLA